jgi:hypothetical protein
MPEYASAKLWLTDSSFSKQSTTSSFVRISKITFLPFGLNINKKQNRNQVLSIHPIPAADRVFINSTEIVKRFQLVNSIGNTVWEGIPLDDNSIRIPESLPAGNYWLRMALSSGTVTKYLQIIR